MGRCGICNEDLFFKTVFEVGYGSLAVKENIFPGMCPGRCGEMNIELPRRAYGSFQFL